MNMLIISLQILFVFYSSTVAHVCMWKPMQRGNFSLEPWASQDCNRTISPCGGLDSSASKQRTTIQSGSFYTVEFQQHLNYYYSPNPGQLDISFALGPDPNENDFRTLSSFNDYNPMNFNTQTNFSIQVQLPNIECDQCVLRVRYSTNNHERTFYQCSDIQLVKDNLNTKSLSQIDTPDCCSPSSFEMSFIHWMENAVDTIIGRISYDQSLKQMYTWMVVKNVEYNIWMNFTLGKQFINNVNENSCYSFELDSWNDWCYGNRFNQSEEILVSNKGCLGDEDIKCNQWKNGDFLFESRSSECFPSSLSRLSNNERIFYFNHEKGPIPIEVFQPNKICLI